MSRASRARKVAIAAAYGGGGLGVLSAAAAGVMVGEIKLARRTVGAPEFAKAPDANRVWGAGSGDPLVFAMLGDSSAAGLGVHDGAQTPGAIIARGLSSLAARPVRLVNVAVVGAQTADVHSQLVPVLEAHPEVALVMIGVNDVTHRTRPAISIRHLGEIVSALRAAGIATVVATCPDLGSVKPIVPPLRWLARVWSRNLAAAQTIATIEAGGRTVSLGSILGREFATNHRELFSSDGFHPSAHGYAAAAATILPSVAAAVGVWPAGDSERIASFARQVRPISRAAARAAAHAGTEVMATTVDGHDRGRRGRWALQRRRRGVATDTR